jgi:anti-sigma factor RsiW
MKMDQITCDPNRLNRFFDGELGPDESARMAHHLKYCRSCQEALRDNQSVCTLLRTGLDEALARINFEEVEEGVLALIHRKRGPWWMKLRDQFVSKKFYVPAAAVATGLVLFFAFVTGPAPAPGPSAIINSFQGDVGSVMILETEKSHHTILWFSENPSPGGDDHGLQQIQTAL